MKNMRRIRCFLALTGTVLGVSVACADTITTYAKADYPGTAEVIAAPAGDASFGDDATGSLAQTFSVDAVFSAERIYISYENDTTASAQHDWSMTVRIFPVADVSASSLVASGADVYSGTFSFPYVGGSDTTAQIDLMIPVLLAASVGNSGYALEITESSGASFNPGFEWLRTTSALNDVYAGGAGYENGTLKGTGTDARDFALAISSIPDPGLTDTLTVAATKDLSNPDIIAYNLGHFHEDSNTHDWWRYSGVNGARIFISPATLESSSYTSSESNGDGVTNLVGFLARKDLVRADPLNESYINWTYFNDRYETKLFGTSTTGNRFTVNHAIGKLRELGIDVLVQATGKENHFPIIDDDDWGGKWELWQHYYIQAFYLGRHFDVHRFQMFNEPDHGNAGGITEANWLMRLQLASDAIQSAIADVNTNYSKSLEPLVYGPVTTSGADNYAGSGWGDYMVANRHVNFLGVTDTNYYVVNRYDYHEYNESASNFGSHLSGLRSALNADMPEGRFPISISEFNVHTASTFDGLTQTIDSPAKYSRLGAIGVNLANQYCKELYCFKFGQATKDGPNYPVGKNGMHYVQNSGAPYDYGGATQGAEVWRLFAKALKPGGEQKDFTKGAGLNDLEIRVTHVPETGNYYVYSSSELAGGTTDITIDTSAWGIPAGTRFLLEEVSDTRNGMGRTWGTVSADGTLFDGTDNVFKQPDETVWLFTIAGKALEDELVVDASEDAMVTDGVNSGNNYGTNTTLLVRNDAATPDGRSASFIKFNLPLFYPPDIHMAVLEVTGKSDTNDLTQAHVYGLDDDAWSASSLTWDNAPNLLKGAAAGNLITNRVVDGQGDSAYIQGQLVFPNDSNKDRFIDVTDFLKSQPGRDVSFMITQDPRWDVTLPSLAVGDTQPGGQIIKSIEDGSGAKLRIVLLEDTDGDGISDESETNTFGTNPALADTDGDGLTDGEEIFAGTDPDDSGSRFIIPVVELQSGDFYVEWPSITDRTYVLQRSGGLQPTDWVDIYTAAGTGATMSYLDTSTTNAFYRLNVK